MAINKYRDKDCFCIEEEKEGAEKQISREKV